MLFPYAAIAICYTFFPQLDTADLAWLAALAGAFEYYRLGRFHDLLRKTRRR